MTVFFETRDLVESVTSKPGVKTYQAFVGQDYERPSVVSVRFAPGEVGLHFTGVISIVIKFTIIRPKQRKLFFVTVNEVSTPCFHYE